MGLADLWKTNPNLPSWKSAARSGCFRLGSAYSWRGQKAPCIVNAIIYTEEASAHSQTKMDSAGWSLLPSMDGSISDNVISPTRALIPNWGFSLIRFRHQSSILSTYSKCTCAFAHYVLATDINKPPIMIWNICRALVINTERKYSSVLGEAMCTSSKAPVHPLS